MYLTRSLLEEQSDGPRNRSAAAGIVGNTELRALIAACINNELASQKVLYDRYHPQAMGVIRRYVGDNHLANELLNDVFFTVLTKLEQYAFKGAFEGWIRQITINRVGMHFRQNVKHEQVHYTDIPDTDFSLSSTAVSQLGYKELLGLIHELPDTQRAVFNLAVFEDCSHKEIGKILGMKVNNSRWYLNDARNRLKEKIKCRL